MWKCKICGWKTVCGESRGQIVTNSNYGKQKCTNGHFLPNSHNGKPTCICPETFTKQNLHLKHTHSHTPHSPMDFFLLLILAFFLIRFKTAGEWDWTFVSRFSIQFEICFDLLLLFGFASPSYCYFEHMYMYSINKLIRIDWIETNSTSLFIGRWYGEIHVRCVCAHTDSIYTDG